LGSGVGDGSLLEGGLGVGQGSVGRGDLLLSFRVGEQEQRRGVAALAGGGGAAEVAEHAGFLVGIEEGEDLLTCAIRETREETGVTVNPELIDKNEKYFVFYRRGIPHSRCAYFEVHIESLEQIGLDSPKLPKEQLQAEEVDWAGFIPIAEAVGKLSRSQQIIAQRLIETIE
jgi:predicted NUDIX family NTP pyrophosphohydrolase